MGSGFDLSWSEAPPLTDSPLCGREWLRRSGQGIIPTGGGRGPVLSSVSPSFRFQHRDLTQACSDMSVSCSIMTVTLTFPFPVSWENLRQKRCEDSDSAVTSPQPEDANTGDLMLLERSDPPGEARLCPYRDL